MSEGLSVCDFNFDPESGMIQIFTNNGGVPIDHLRRQIVDIYSKWKKVQAKARSSPPQTLAGDDCFQ